MLVIPQLTAVALSAFVAAEAASASPSSRDIWLPDGFRYPNGIAFDGEGRLFVGSVVSGDLVAIELGERPSVRFPETAGRYAGTAVRFDEAHQRFWIASPDFLGEDVDGEVRRRPHRVAVVDAATGEVEWSVAVPDGGFVNDIALDGQGGAYLTDSSGGRVFHVARPGVPFTVVADGLASETGGLGPAGIAVDADGSLIVGIYADGRLIRLRPALEETPAAVEEIALGSPVENPDGLAFADDGRLLVVDGGVASGNGRLLAVDLASPEPHAVKVLVSGLDLPVNLSVDGGVVALSESRIRYRMVDDPTLPVPDRFRIVLVDLAADNGERPMPRRSEEIR